MMMGGKLMKAREMAREMARRQRNRKLVDIIPQLTVLRIGFLLVVSLYLIR